MALWDITDYAYSGTSFSVSSQSPAAVGIVFKDDGTKFYIIDSANDAVNEYTMSTAWDVSSASFTTSLDISGQETAPGCLFIGNSGTKLYFSGTNQRNISEYTLSTAWDVSSATFVQNADISGQENLPTGLFFRSNGTKCFLLGRSGDDVNEYTLSTAWDVSTISFVDSFSVSSQTTSPGALTFGDSGSTFYVAGDGAVYQYDMSTAWDVSTASFIGSKDFSAQEAGAEGLFFRPNGDNFYLVGPSDDRVYQYNAVTVISAAAAMAGTSTFTPLPANISAAATMAGTSTFAGVGDGRQAAKGRAVNEARAGGTNAALSVSLNSAITEPANPSGNT